MKTIIDKLQTLNTEIRIPMYQTPKINYSNIEKIPINYSNPNAELYQLRLVLGVNFTVSNGIPFDVSKSYAIQNLKFAIYEDVLGKLDKIMYAINNYDISQALNLCEDLRRNLLTVKLESQESEFEEGKVTQREIFIPVDRIEPNPYKPRRIFPQQELDQLAESISEIGLLEPILVRKIDDHYQIAAGERRWRAHKQLHMHTIEALVTSISDSDMAVFALDE